MDLTKGWHQAGLAATAGTAGAAGIFGSWYMVSKSCTRVDTTSYDLNHDYLGPQGYNTLTDRLDLRPLTSTFYTLETDRALCYRDGPGDCSISISLPTVTETPPATSTVASPGTTTTFHISTVAPPATTSPVYPDVERAEPTKNAFALSSALFHPKALAFYLMSSLFLIVGEERTVWSWLWLALRVLFTAYAICFPFVVNRRAFWSCGDNQWRLTRTIVEYAQDLRNDFGKQFQKVEAQSQATEGTLKDLSRNVTEIQGMFYASREQESVRDDLSSLMNLAADVSERINQLEAKLSDKDEAIERAKERIVQLEAQLTCKDEAAEFNISAETQNVIDGLSLRVSNVEQINKRIDQIEVQLSADKDQATEVLIPAEPQKVINGLSSRISDVEQVKERIDQLQAQISAGNDKSTDLSTQTQKVIDGLSSRISNVEQANGRIDKLEMQLSSDNDKANKFSTDTQKVIDGLSSKIADVEHQVQEMNEALKISTEKHQALSSKVANVNLEVLEIQDVYKEAISDARDAMKSCSVKTKSIDEKTDGLTEALKTMCTHYNPPIVHEGTSYRSALETLNTQGAPVEKYLSNMMFMITNDMSHVRSKGESAVHAAQDALNRVIATHAARPAGNQGPTVFGQQPNSRPHMGPHANHPGQFQFGQKPQPHMGPHANHQYSFQFEQKPQQQPPRQSPQTPQQKPQPQPQTQLKTPLQLPHNQKPSGSMHSQGFNPLKSAHPHQTPSPSGPSRPSGLPAPSAPTRPPSQQSISAPKAQDASKIPVLQPVENKPWKSPTPSSSQESTSAPKAKDASMPPGPQPAAKKPEPRPTRPSSQQPTSASKAKEAPKAPEPGKKK